MPYNGYAVEKSTFEKESVMQDAQDTLLVVRQRRIKSLEVEGSILREDLRLQTQALAVQGVMQMSCEKTVAELREQLTTLYKITQKPRFKIPIVLPLGLGAIIGGLIVSAVK